MKNMTSTFKSNPLPMHRYFVSKQLMGTIINQHRKAKQAYIYESGFGEVMTLFSDESTISEEVPIDYENKVAIYDDYCDDMYAIKNNDNHETCHHDFNFQLDYASHDSYFVEFSLSSQA